MAMDYASTKLLANAFARDLADPHSPACCYVCFGCYGFGLGDRVVEHLARLRVECHALFDACLAIMCTRRTPAQLARLALRIKALLARCSVHGADRSFSALPPDQHLHILFESASYVVRAGVHLGEHAFIDRAVVGSKSFSDKQGRWPARVEQLFPGGVHATVESLLAHCELFISHGPILVLGHMIDVARPSILPVLSSDPFRGRMVDIALKMLDPVASGLTQRAPWLTENRCALMKATYLIDALMVGPGARPREALQFFAGYEDALLRKIASVSEPMGDDDELLEALSLWCPHLTKDGARTMPPRMQRWLDARRSHSNCGNSAAHALQNLIFTLTSSRVCAGPECTLSTVQTQLSACARCRAPRYCSRSCQRADWKGEGGASLPHRTICPVLARFDVQACSQLKLTAFVELFERVEDDFDEADRTALHALIHSMSAREHHEIAHSSSET